MDWESRYLTGDTPWEKGAPAPPLVEWLSRNEIRGHVLVPGCGSGHEVRELARAGAEPIGLDVAPSAINFADSQPRVGPERYRLADFFELPPELAEAFDWVFEHTCFCAIEPDRRVDYVTAALAALKPGGRLLAIFYLDPGNDEKGPPYGVARDELDALFAKSFEMLEEYVPTRAFPGREGRELVRLLRRRDQSPAASRRK
ncbi:MAG: methyltransferase domain-containing protein [Terrimicrobiaceae bacterium]|nr:methyltransferase domain-containing protein [Terrimicrobiaceae bacterium]